MTFPSAFAQCLAPVGATRIQQAIARLQPLPAFYPAVQNALALIADPLAPDSQVQQMICSNEALAHRILAMANFAYFSMDREVRTISLAVTLLGRERVSTLLWRFLAEELLQMLSGHDRGAHRIRETSLATAAAAHSIAERLLRSDKEEIRLAAFLHNVGDLVLLTQFRSSYEEMSRLAGEIPRKEAEKVVFCMEPSRVGSELLEAWSFPPFFPTIVAHHADPWSLHFAAAPAVAIVLVHTARRLVEAWGAGCRADEVARSFSARLLSTLQVNRQFLADLYVELPGEIERYPRLS